MTIAQRIFKNSFFLFSGQIVSKLINFLLVLILTRIFSTEDFGIFSYTLAYTGMFMILCNLGLNTLVIRDIAKDKSCGRQIVEDMFPIVLYLSFISLILMNSLAWLSCWSAYERMIIFFLSFYVVFDAFSRSFFAVMRAHERMELEALISICERIFLVAITLAIGFLNLPLTALVFAFMVIEVIKTLLTMIIIRKKLMHFSLKLHTHNAFALLKNAIPFALMAIFTTISMRIDTVMIKIFHSSELSGIYNIAHKLIESITFIPENIYHAFFPVVASLYLIDKSKFNVTLLNVFKLTSLLAIPIACLFYFRASDIIDLLFDVKYHSAYIALQWLALAMFALFIKYAVAVVMNVSGRQHLFSLYIGISMAVNIILNLLLIPSYGLMGAGLATFASELLTTMMGLVSLRALFTLKHSLSYALRFIIATAALSWMLTLLKSIPVLIMIPIFLLLYILCLYILKLVKFKDVAYFRQFLMARFNNGL